MLQLLVVEFVRMRMGILDPHNLLEDARTAARAPRMSLPTAVAHFSRTVSARTASLLQTASVNTQNAIPTSTRSAQSAIALRRYPLGMTRTHLASLDRHAWLAVFAGKAYMKLKHAPMRRTLDVQGVTSVLLAIMLRRRAHTTATPTVNLVPLAMPRLNLLWTKLARGLQPTTVMISSSRALTPRARHVRPSWRGRTRGSFQHAQQLRTRSSGLANCAQIKSTSLQTENVTKPLMIFLLGRLWTVVAVRAPIFLWATRKTQCL